MFTPIDYEHWDRRETFETFEGYTYTVTADIDITRFLSRVRERGVKFYPAACYCITRAANAGSDYRFCKSAGRIGYFDAVDAHYTLMRRGTHLFTHQLTKFTADFDAFYQSFLADQEAAEGCGRLYCRGDPPLDCIHISIVPNLTFSSLSYSKPARFSHYGEDTTSYIPFVTMGRYAARDGATLLPVTTEFHHAVNDGYHAGRFYEELSASFGAF